MHIVIPDDYQDAVRSLDCFARLADHDVTIHRDTVKDVDALAERFADADALVLIRERTAIGDALLARLPRLKLISQTGKGTAHIDVKLPMRPSLALLTFFVTVGATAIELPRPTEKWITLRADEFEIISNASPAATTEIAEDLLRMRAAVGKVTRLNVRSPLPTKVFIFANERSFAPYREAVFGRDADNISGIFLGGDNGNSILVQAGSANGVDRIVFHELTHYFVKNTVAGLPLWVNEGIAEYYSTFRTSGAGVHIGRPVEEHVLWLRGKPLIPLRELVSVDRDSPIYNERSRQGVFYAQSWALLHYLMIGSEERRGQLTTYLSLIGAQKPADEAFSTAFGVT